MIKKYLKFSLFAFLCFFLTNKYIVKADTYSSKEFTAQLYDNYGPTLSAVTTNNTGSYWTGYIPTMVANSAGSAWGISSPIPLLANHTYTLSLNPGSYIGNTVLSTYNRIGVGISMSNAKASYENGGVTVNYSKALGNGYIQYAFTPSSAGSFIIIPFATDSSGNDVRFDLYNVIIEDLGSAGVSQTDINNSLNNQTNIIQNSINDMSQNIQDSIKDSFNDCHQSVNLFDQKNIGAYNSTISYSNDGFIVNSSSAWGYALSTMHLPAGTYTLSGKISGNVNFVEIYKNDTWLAGAQLNSSSYTFTLNETSVIYFRFYATTGQITSGATTFFKIQLQEGSTATSYEPYGQEVCTNKIDETNDQLGDLNDNITNSNTTDATNEAGGFFNDFTTDTHGLTAIITAPLSLISKITSSSCSPLVLPLPYVDKDLTLPCMGSIYSQYFGSFLSIYQLITFGIVAYWVCVRIFNLVKDFKNPDHDEIEVLDL